RWLLHQAHRVVLLAALTAEGNRVEKEVPVVGDKLLGMDGDEALFLGLDGREGGVAAANELVEAESEDRETCVGLLDLPAGEELGLDLCNATILVSTHELRELS